MKSYSISWRNPIPDDFRGRLSAAAARLLANAQGNARGAEDVTGAGGSDDITIDHP